MASNRSSACLSSARSPRATPSARSANGSANRPLLQPLGCLRLDALAVAERGESVQERRRRLPLPVELGRRELREFAEFLAGPARGGSWAGRTSPGTTGRLPCRSPPLCFPAAGPRPGRLHARWRQRSSAGWRRSRRRAWPRPGWRPPPARPPPPRPAPRPSARSRSAAGSARHAACRRWCGVSPAAASVAMRAGPRRLAEVAGPQIHEERDKHCRGTDDRDWAAREEAPSPHPSAVQARSKSLAASATVERVPSDVQRSSRSSQPFGDRQGRASGGFVVVAHRQRGERLPLGREPSSGEFQGLLDPAVDEGHVRLLDPHPSPLNSFPGRGRRIPRPRGRRCPALAAWHPRSPRRRI